ncbi:hypothetical protein ACJ73_08387 [Blastomyces percursus]|uniref:Uncharacterized protein n=1 Tax=Blastomyces percursus TaxID=1658174 RepID=A0A1J9QVP6_9EURO|nr:hypothetical protein ACJ73_08387 [Blastomyces percursus]
MGDAVRPSVEECRSVYERGFRTWLNLYLRATQESCLPQICFQVQSVILKQPHFPHDLDLKHSYDYLSATGTSIWEASQGPCKIPALKKQLDIPISIPSPTRLTLSSNSNPSRHNLFSREENHITVLILAWSYIFSARWADLMPGSTVLEYTHRQAQWKEDEPADSDSVLVGIGDVDEIAARWWAAILASGEGWQAYISSGEVKFRSPWSIIYDSPSSFTLSRPKACLIPPNRAVPWAIAIRLLSDYCTLHGVMDQSYAALSAVLFLPYLHGKGKQICLPRPRFYHGMQVESAVPQPSVQQLDLVWAQMAHHLDRLLTLSCNTKGIRAMLSSIFYEPGIACNCVSPWLQSIFAILDSVENRRILAHILMSRTPHLAFLWLGGIIMGVHKDVLKDGRFGLIPVEPHGAMWSGTVQSFIQEPTQQHTGINGSISRSDECRLLYLTQEERHRRWPMCPWVPFGASDLENTEIDVRLHAECPGHYLKYAGWKWACQNAMVTHQLCDSTLMPTQPLAQDVASHIRVNYEAFDLEDESASENATRSIFGWLRFEGYPSQERDIYQHEWVKITDSDDEDLPDCGSGKSPIPPSSTAKVDIWIHHNI